MSAQGPVLGIDLGTTNSVVAVADGSRARVIADPDGHRLIPSTVSFTPDGVILVGTPARERRLVDAPNTVYSVKRLIGRPFTSPEVQRARERLAFKMTSSKTGGVQVEVRKGTYALAEISAMVLRHIRKVAEAELERECNQAVVTVPANFNELQRSATQAAGKVAGLDVLRILNEPTAATLAYGYGKTKPERVAVYDLGGGTFDFTMLELDGDVFEVVGTAGDTFLGGDDIDLLVAERMSEACLQEHRFDPREDPQCFERVRAAAEWAKCQLTGVEEADLTLEELFVDGSGRTMDFTFQMKRAELEQRTQPILARSFDVVNEVLRESGRRPKEVDSVVLVGGSTRMPLVRRMVEEFFGKTPRLDIDPDLVVAQGAAIHAWTLAGQPRDGGAARKPPSALGKVALRKITVADVKKRPKRSSLVEEVVAVRPRIPKQPAFAPEHPDDELARSPVSVMAAPTAIGTLGDSGLLMLDDPSMPAEFEAQPTNVNRPVRKATHMGFGDRAPMPAPAIDAPFGGEVLPLPEITVPLPRPQPPAPPPPPAHAAPPPPPPPHLAARPPPPPPPSPPGPSPPGQGRWESAPPPASPPVHPALAGAMGAGLMNVALTNAGPAPAPRIPEVAISAAPPPLLMDVTPLSIGLETAGGFCQHLVPRGAPVPAERTRTFSTARDDQESVELRIAQGESPRFEENALLGMLGLSGLRKGARGSVRIEVTFLLDASGVLDVRAVDTDTRQEQRTRIDLQGGIDADEIEAMRRRQESELG